MVWSQTWSWSISWTVWPRLSREDQWFGPNRSWGPTVYETLDIHDPQFSQWPLLGCARYRWGGWDPEELSDCWLAHNQHGVEPSASSSSIESRLEPRSSKLHTKCFDGKLVSPALLTSGSTGVQALPASLPDSRLPTLHQFQWPLCYHWGNLPKFMWSIRGCATHTHTHTHTHSVCCLRPHHPSSLCTALGKDFPRMVSGWLLIPGWPRLPLKPSESLWGGLWLLLWSTVSVFSLVCLQGGDDEMEDGLAQLLSLACQSVLVFSFCQRVSRAGLKPMSSTLKEKRTYLQLKL